MCGGEGGCTGGCMRVWVGGCGVGVGGCLHKAEVLHMYVCI